jgi:hypothetical protein
MYAYSIVLTLAQATRAIGERMSSQEFMGLRPAAKRALHSGAALAIVEVNWPLLDQEPPANVWRI